MSLGSTYARSICVEAGTQVAQDFVMVWCVSESAASLGGIVNLPPFLITASFLS